MGLNRYVIALTGNVACGKSLALSIFKNLKIECLSADKIAKELTEIGQPAYHVIVDHFGKTILTANYTLNRKKLRDIITNNAKQRIWLEQVLHPLIRLEIETQLSKVTSSYAVVEIPLLTDLKYYPYIKRVLWIKAPLKQQLERIMARDHSSLDEAQALIKIQPDDKIRQNIADDIIVNDKTPDEFKKNLLQLHEQYLKCALLPQS